ncbi:MAG TPA: thioredoxin domain-containing protein [Chitinophagales bacterium]|nr:thioredoxin domain-containing protein [Chitinophagales bacterium]
MNKEHPFSNHLVNESSPYLLQHAHNPVDWYPWGKEALEKAKKENKLLIISIGYAACHWCHVMEHESFEDTAVARLMNEKFVSIKVDREERPDIDQIYMNASMLINGSGGWPLNAIALPDGRPIYAGTYFPKQQWVNVLQQVHDYYLKDPGKAEQYARQLQAGIRSVELISAKAPATSVTKNDIDTAYRQLIITQDFRKGGRQGAPKFPMPVNYEFLLAYSHFAHEEDAHKAVQLTLDNMMNGGIYDHIGGGFARYSVDDEWHVPHFEKMLYDNAQLVSLYAHAWQLTKKPQYRQAVYETLTWVEREMTSGEGGFYSSLDADSEGEEGKFYVWTADEIKLILGNDAPLFMEYYDVSEPGNWEDGKNVLRRKKDELKIAEEYRLSPEELSKTMNELKKKMFNEREKRARPGLDDKILTSWNALMLKGYADASRVFGEKNFLEKAFASARFILTKAASGDKLFRNYKNGRATIDGFLDDYAYAIDAFIALYEATFDEQWLSQAKRWTDYVLQHFFDPTSGMFYYTSTQHEELIARKMELSDNVMPASNSVMAKNLFVLGQLFYNEDYLKTASQMFHNIKSDLLKHAPYYANWASLACWLAEEPYEVAIVGNDFEKIRQELDSHFLPHVLLLGGKTEGTLPLLKNKLVEGQTTIYVCRNKTCKLPVLSVEEALKQMK